MFRPSFNDLTFSSKSKFTVSLNLNKAGPCDCSTSGKPNFGDYDFFSSNMAIFNNTYEGAEELKINFELQASENFKRELFQYNQKRMCLHATPKKVFY